MNKAKLLLLTVILSGLIALLLPSFSVPAASARLRVHFVHTAAGKPLLQDSLYLNPFNETYSVSKLKYYVSNWHPGNKGSCFLINAFSDPVISLDIPPGQYESISFLLGVDSVHNSSGAQTGALDPLNDMFWTWNTGYVMFKLEGVSAASKSDLNRIEQHTGGYRSPFATMRQVNIVFPAGEKMEAGKTYDLNIEMNLDKYWKGANEIRIAEHPVITKPGNLAVMVADNFPGMFSFKSFLSH
ncbi:MAG: hypothetical protein JWQ27_1331 [Ferruginibacter sp.]|nr:hypothetical protein [Ferruginibacter sp.]